VTLVVDNTAQQTRIVGLGSRFTNHHQLNRAVINI
jgi:hypothetical protein